MTKSFLLLFFVISIITTTFAQDVTKSTAWALIGNPLPAKDLKEGQTNTTTGFMFESPVSCDENGVVISYPLAYNHPTLYVYVIRGNVVVQVEAMLESGPDTGEQWKALCNKSDAKFASNKLYYSFEIVGRNLFYY